MNQVAWARAGDGTGVRGRDGGQKLCLRDHPKVGPTRGVRFRHVRFFFVYVQTVWSRGFVTKRFTVSCAMPWYGGLKSDPNGV